MSGEGEQRKKARRGGFVRFPWVNHPPQLAGGDAPGRGTVFARNDAEFAFETALDTLSGTAQRIQYLWIAFITVMLTFAVTTANVSHKMLLLQEGVKLPLVDLTIPLIGYAVVGPALLLIMHLYLLAMLIALARTVPAFDAALTGLKTEVGEPLSEAERDKLRSRLGNALFALLLVGPKREREGALGVLYAIIALTTVALAPIAVLFLFQLMFLPYQSDEITWWHRVAVWMDVAMVLMLWPSYRWYRGERFLRLPHFSLKTPGAAAKGVLIGPATLLVALLTLSASFPCDGIVEYERYDADDPVRGAKKGEFRTDLYGKRIPVAVELSTCSDGVNQTLRYSSRQVELLLGHLFGYSAQDEPYGPFKVWNFFDNRLVLRKQVLVDQELVKQLKSARAREYERMKSRRSPVSVTSRNGTAVMAAEKNLSPSAAPEQTDAAGGRDSASERFSRDFEGRRLRAADFTETDLTMSDFRDADLTASKLDQTWLISARFDSAQLAYSDLYQTKMHGASFRGASLEGASLYGTEMHGANLNEANLNFTRITLAKLQGASMIASNLIRAQLNEVDMRLVNLDAIIGYSIFNNVALDGARVSELGNSSIVIIDGGSAWETRGSLDLSKMIVLRTPVVDAKRALEGELSFVEDDLEDVIKNVVPDGPRKPELLRDLDRLLLLRADVRSSADAAATKEKASTEKFSSRDDRGFEEPPIQWAPVFDNKNNDVVQNLYKMICDKEQGTFGLFSLKLISYRVYSYPGGPRGQPVFGVLPSSVRKQWLQEFKTAREAPKDSLVTCEAARQLSDRQYDFLLRASDEADAWAIEQKEFEERAITAEWEFAAEAAKKLQERPKP